MDNKITYHEQNDIDNTLKLREVLKTLPPFCRDYFRAIDATTTTKTRISYAYDIRIFFQFLLEQNPAFKDWSIDAFTVDVLDQLSQVTGEPVPAPLAALRDKKPRFHETVEKDHMVDAVLDMLR